MITLLLWEPTSEPNRTRKSHAQSISSSQRTGPRSRSIWRQVKNHSSRTPQKITHWNRTGSSWETWSLTAWKSLSPRRKPLAVRTYRGWRGLSSDLSGVNNVHTTEPRSPTKTETRRCSGSSGRRLRVPSRQPTGTTWTLCSRKTAEATRASENIWRAHGKTRAESVPSYRMEGSPLTLRTRLTCWIISSAQSSLEKIAWTYHPRWNPRTPRCPGSLYQVQESSSFSANSTPGKPQELTTSLRFFWKLVPGN